jgi:hypothetical protein
VSGLKRLVTHVRATNVPSIAAFKNQDFHFNAMVFSKTSGALLGALGMRRLGLQALRAACIDPAANRPFHVFQGWAE